MKASKTTAGTIFQSVTKSIATVITNSNKTNFQLVIDTNKTLTSSMQSALSEIGRVKNVTVKAQVAALTISVGAVQNSFKKLSDSSVVLRTEFLNKFSNKLGTSYEDLSTTLGSFTDTAGSMIGDDNLKVKNVPTCQTKAFKGFDDILKNASSDATSCINTYTVADTAFTTRLTQLIKNIANVGAVPLGNVSLCMTTNQINSADAIDKASDCNRMSLVSCLNLVGELYMGFKQNITLILFYFWIIQSIKVPIDYAAGFSNVIDSLEVSYQNMTDTLNNCVMWVHYDIWRILYSINFLTLGTYKKELATLRNL